MKSTAWFLLTLALAGTVAAQDSFSFEKKYKEGDKDAYNYKLSLEGGPGSIDISFVFNQAVIKVYENGDADLETEVGSMKLMFNGQEMPTPGGQTNNTKRMQRVNKFGQVVASQTEGTGQGGRMSMNFMQFVGLGIDRPIKVGETINVDYKDPKQPKRTSKGTIKLDSITAGLAKLVANLDVTMPEMQSDKPLKLAINATYDLASTKLEKADGTASNLPPQGGMEIKAMQFSLERVKA
jgi:hypothetical protein